MKRALLMGTGALSLGFLGHRLAPFYELHFADLSEKTELLQRLDREKSYLLNICTLEGIVAERVEGALSASVAGSKAFLDFLDQADIVLTAVGVRNLPNAVEQIAPALNRARARRFVLFCENGLHIARTNRASFSGSIVLVDTVMSRMCRTASADETNYRPLFEDWGHAVVAEEYCEIPLDRSLCPPEVFLQPFRLVSPERFRAWEDIKLFAHNGIHAFIAYHAHLAGVASFSDVPAEIRERARQCLLGEVCPALLKAHPVLDRQWLVGYCEELLQRIYSRTFHDSIARGVRGIRDKLAPGERILGGIDFIRGQGIEPRLYAATKDAALAILAGEGDGRR